MPQNISSASRQCAVAAGERSVGDLVAGRGLRRCTAVQRAQGLVEVFQSHAAHHAFGRHMVMATLHSQRSTSASRSLIGLKAVWPPSPCNGDPALARGNQCRKRPARCPGRSPRSACRRPLCRRRSACISRGCRVGTDKRKRREIVDDLQAIQSSERRVCSMEKPQGPLVSWTKSPVMPVATSSAASRTAGLP